MSDSELLKWAIEQQKQQEELDSRYIHLPNGMMIPKPFCARSEDEREAWLDRVRATKKAYRLLRESNGGNENV